MEIEKLEFKEFLVAVPISFSDSDVMVETIMSDMDAMRRLPTPVLFP